MTRPILAGPRTLVLLGLVVQLLPGATVRTAMAGVSGPAGVEAPAPAAAPASPPASAASSGSGYLPVELPAVWGPLQGGFRPSSRGPSQAVLIIGASGRSLEGMDPLARRLQAAGYTVLSVRNPVNIMRKDGRGIPIIDKRRMSSGGVPDLARDVEVALQYLRKAPAASPAPIVIVGEGLGVPIAAQLAADSDRVAGVVFVTPAKECDPFVTRALLERACQRKPALLITGQKDETYRGWFEQSVPSMPELTFVDPLLRPGGAEEEARAWASYEIPFVEDVASWLIARIPPGKP